MNTLAPPSRQLDVTVLEAVNHLLTHHPQLAPAVERLAAQRLGRFAADGQFLAEIQRPLLTASRAQLRQDLFVLTQLGFQREGFFVEFGATNGVDLSNTCLLEREFDWRGILAEPATLWHEALRANRRCHIDTRCVWSQTGHRLSFNEVAVAELSTVDAFSASDGHREARKNGRTYEVDTVSLNDLLAEHDAPRRIDYLSVDTEGSEYEILSHFDFDRYDVRVITCEHNYTDMREKLFALLTSHGFVRKFEQLSQFDDWYVKAS